MSNTTSNRETRLASAEKSKSSYKSASHTKTTKLQSANDLQIAQNKVSHTIDSQNSLNRSSHMGSSAQTMTLVGAARNDRLVAHRRIDLMCNEQAAHEQQNQSSSSDTVASSQHDGVLNNSRISG